MSITIPPAALEAGARCLCPDSQPCDKCRSIIRDAFLAMLKAWEGAKTIRDDGRRQTYAIPALILPLPQEASDD